MNEEVLIPKMTRQQGKVTRKKIKISFLNLVIVLFCTLLIVGASFVNLDIRHYIIPADLFTNKNLTGADFVFRFFLIPQIPIVMFICSFLGKRMATTSVFLYIMAGLTIAPIFALGGGITYLFEYGCGYILAYLPAVIIAGNLLNKYGFLDMIKATLAGVLTIHLLGILYMVVVALVKQIGSEFIYGWIVSQSGLKIVYDIILSFLLIMFGKYFNKALKFVLE